MATQSTAPTTLSDGKAQNPGHETLEPMDEGGQEAKGDDANESLEKSGFAISESVREEQVQNAVKFLSHPKVRGSPVIYRRSFLEKKGLTKEEIDEAFHRVPDPPSNVINGGAITTTQATETKSSSGLQPQIFSQTSQPGCPPISGVATVATLQQSKFHWSHAILAVGVLAASGAGSAVLFKNAIVPRLTAWIQKVVAEENDFRKNDVSRSNLAEAAAEAAKAAASAAAVVAKASQELLNAKNEERKFIEAFKEMLNIQVEEMKSMGNVIHKLESTLETSKAQDKRVEENVQSRTWNNGTTNNRLSTSQVNLSNPSTVSKVVKANDMQDVNFGTVRPSSAPASAEPMMAPHPKSYIEIIEMIARGEKPPNIKEINDMPPNPNQPIPKPLLAPRLKPWEVNQQSQNRPTYGLESRKSGHGLSSEIHEDNFQLNGRYSDASEPSRKKTVKITDAKPEAEESRHQPQSPIQKQLSGNEELTVYSDDREDLEGRTYNLVAELERSDKLTVHSDGGEDMKQRALETVVPLQRSDKVIVHSVDGEDLKGRASDSVVESERYDKLTAHSDGGENLKKK